MPFYVYVLGSIKNKLKKTYVGWTNNLTKRLDKHNRGKGAKATRGRKWKIIYSKKYESKKEVMSKEYHFKKNRKFRKYLSSKI